MPKNLEQARERFETLRQAGDTHRLGVMIDELIADISSMTATLASFVERFGWGYLKVKALDAELDGWQQLLDEAAVVNRALRVAAKLQQPVKQPVQQTA